MSTFYIPVLLQVDAAGYDEARELGESTIGKGVSAIGVEATDEITVVDPRPGEPLGVIPPGQAIQVPVITEAE